MKIDKDNITIVIETEYDWDNMNIETVWVGPKQECDVWTSYRYWSRLPENRMQLIKKDGTPYKGNKTKPLLNFYPWLEEIKGFIKFTDWQEV